MGARERLLGIAGRAVLRASARTERKDDATRRSGSAPAFMSAGLGYSSDWDVDRAVKDGYEKVIWAFSAIDAIATKASSWPIRVMEGDEPDWRRVDDPLATVLNTRANLIDGPARFFRYRLSSQLILSKAGVFVEVIPTRVGGIAALNLLPAGRTKPVPDADRFLAGFEVTLPTGDRQYLPAYSPETGYGVVWIRKPHPTNPYSGVTPLEAAGISLDLDFYARLYNRNFLLNDGRSGQIVAVKGDLSYEDAQELKARFSPGMGGVGRTTVIAADALSVQDTAVTPRDAQYAELRGLTKEDLLIALGTPESVIGNASGRTFANADAERENWLEVTVANHVAIIEAGLHQLTAGGWDDNRHVWHDTSGEVILNRRQYAREDQATAQFTAGLITIDEHRAIAGRELLNVPGSRVVFGTAGRAPIGAPADQDAASNLKSISMSRSSTTDSLNGAPGAPAAPGADGAPEAKALPRPVPAGRALCRCCDGVGEHSSGFECYRCDASGSVTPAEDAEPIPCGGAQRAAGASASDVAGKELPKTQKCAFCSAQATTRVIHSEGMAYVPACDDHVDKAKDAAARCTPDGTVDRSNIDAVRPIPAAKSVGVTDYLTGGQRLAVDAYLRASIEAKGAASPAYAAAVAELDAAVAATVALEPGVVFRGLDQDLFDELAAGDTVTDAAYSSATADETLAAGWGTSGVLALSFEAGQRMLLVNERDQEVLLPRDLTFVVDSIEDQEGQRVVSASVVA